MTKLPLLRRTCNEFAWILMNKRIDLLGRSAISLAHNHCLEIVSQARLWLALHTMRAKEKLSCDMNCLIDRQEVSQPRFTT